MIAANRSERRAYLLEKDIWVVEALRILVEAPFGRHLTFKGDTSLAKAWRAVRRFSEDIDITYDTRAFAPDLASGAGGEALPPTRSQEQRWTKAIRNRLASWVREQALPAVEADSMANDNLKVMVDLYDGLASHKNKNARRCLAGVIALFLSTLVAVTFTEEVAESTIGGAETSASAIIKKQLEEVRLWRGSSFDSIAIIRGGETTAVAGDDGLVMISDGDRSSWRKAPSNTERDIYGIALSDDGRTAVAVGRRGLIRFSSDGGETWVNAGNIAAKNINGVALSGGGMTAVAVGDEGLVRISRDRGETWVNPGNITAENINGVALSQNGEVAIFVGDDGLVRVSTNGGATWNTRDMREKRDDFRAVAVSTDGKTAIAVGRRGLVSRSGDSGKSWDLVQSNVGVHLNAVALSGDGAVAISVGDDGTVLVSTNGGKNWNSRDSKTSNDLNAVALEEADIAALIVGDKMTILQLTLSGQEELSKITSVRKLQIRRSLSKEEEEIEKLGERGSQDEQDEYDATKDKVLICSTGLRIGSILVFLLWVRQMANLMHYNLRLAEYYDARAKAIRLFSSEELSRPGEGDVSSRQERIALLEQLMHAVSPDNIDIGRSPRSVVEHAMRLPRAMLRREAKD